MPNNEQAEPCEGCGTGRTVPPGPLCAKCWLERAPYGLKAEYLMAEAAYVLRQLPSETRRYLDAKGALVSFALRAYRMEALRKIWRTTWRKKFKAKFKAEHDFDRWTAKVAADGPADDGTEPDVDLASS